MGLPAIATNFSGQTEFMMPEHSYLIKVESMENAIGKQYEQGQKWGEPDLDHLKSLMRRVYTNREEAREIGKKGQAFVRQNFNRHAVAKVLHKRWMEIGLALPAESTPWVGSGPPPAKSAETIVLKPRRRKQKQDTDTDASSSASSGETSHPPAKESTAVQ